MRQRRRHPGSDRARSRPCRDAGSPRRRDGPDGPGAPSARRAAAASPRSQPSDAITTTAPRAAPRWPHRSRKARRVSPSRVPPLQSGIAAPAARSASSGSRTRSCRVTRVSRVPRVNASVVGRRNAHRGVREPQQPVGVGDHRAADVEQQHEPPRFRALLGPLERGQLAAVGAASGARCGTGRCRRAARAAAAGAAVRHPRREQRDHPGDLLALGVGERGEVVVAQLLAVAGRSAAARRHRRRCWLCHRRSARRRAAGTPWPSRGWAGRGAAAAGQPRNQASKSTS